MGTRSTTHIYDGDIKDENHLVSIYKQYDGYISGYGKDLAEFLSKITVVNEYGMDAKLYETANGMGCLAAQLIKFFKDDVGGYYITNKSDRQEFDYYIYLIDGIINVKVSDIDETFFEGDINQFLEFTKTVKI